MRFTLKENAGEEKQGDGCNETRFFLHFSSAPPRSDPRVTALFRGFPCPASGGLAPAIRTPLCYRRALGVYNVMGALSPASSLIVASVPPLPPRRERGHVRDGATSCVSLRPMFLRLDPKNDRLLSTKLRMNEL